MEPFDGQRGGEPETHWNDHATGSTVRLHSMESAAPRPRPPDRHCKECKHWNGWAESYIGTKRTQQSALCKRDPIPIVMSNPKSGCAFWTARHVGKVVTWPVRPLRPQDGYIDPTG